MWWWWLMACILGHRSSGTGHVEVLFRKARGDLAHAVSAQERCSIGTLAQQGVDIQTKRTSIVVIVRLCPLGSGLTDARPGRWWQSSLGPSPRRCLTVGWLAWPQVRLMALGSGQWEVDESDRARIAHMHACP